MWYAIWDFAYPTTNAHSGPRLGKDIDIEYLRKDNKLLEDPKLYAISKQNTHFSKTVFWSWIAYGFAQALMVIFLSFYSNQIVQAN
jgi:hypothetical protein